MTLTDLMLFLKGEPADAPLVFIAPEAEIGGGYHVTEFQRADIARIDCGGAVRRWSETSFQLFDGIGETHMTTGRFTKIMERSLARIETAGAETVLAEFAPGNGPLRRHDLTRPRRRKNRVEVSLTPRRARCEAAPGCCG